MKHKYENYCCSCSNNGRTKTDCKLCELEDLDWDYPSGYDELWDAEPNCKHNIINPSGGGIRCTKCGGWFCY